MILTDGETEFRKTRCGELSIGANIEGRGHVQANGAVLAERIEVKDHD
jgi:hypothetical protein